jgi:hypothetical protein
MKKVSLLIVVALLAGTFAALPIFANSQPAQQAQPKFQSDEERKAYEAWFNEKDPDKKLAYGEEFLQKFPQSEYLKWVKQSVDTLSLQKLGQKFQTDLSTFYSGPDAVKLEQLISTSEKYLSKQPDQVYITTQLALAVGQGVNRQFYKEIEKAKTYAEKALKLLESPTPPPGYPPDDYSKLRIPALSQLNQLMALYLLQQANPDPENAITFLNKAAESKDWPSAKDPSTYFLRANANYKIYEQLRAAYEALPADQKQGEAGKAQLAKIDPVVEKMVYDYARVVALTNNKADLKPMNEAANESLITFYKYIFNKTDGVEALIKHFEADPTAPPPPRPATSSTSNEAPPDPGEKPAVALGNKSATAPNNKSAAASGNKPAAASSNKRAATNKKKKPRGRRGI